MALTDYLRFLAALAAVLAAIGLCAWFARRFRLGGLAGVVARTGRLQIIETLPIDGRQRLLLIRRDDSEHLLLIGQERSTVIETGIRESDIRLAPAPHGAEKPVEFSVGQP